MSRGQNIKKYLVITVCLLCLIIFAVIKWVIPYINVLKSAHTQNDTQAINDISVAQVIEEKAIIDNTEYNINNVTITKEISDIPENILEQFKDINIADGVITGDYSIVKADINIKNSKDNEKEYTVNNTRIYIYNNSKCIMGYEPVLLSPCTYPQSDLKHFHIVLQSKEDKDITLYYIVDDKYFNNDMKLELNPSGINKDAIAKGDDVSKYIVEFDLKVLAGLENSSVEKTMQSVDDNTSHEVIEQNVSCIIKELEYSINSAIISKNSQSGIAVDSSYSIVSVDMDITNTSQSEAYIDIDNIYVNVIEAGTRVFKHNIKSALVDNKELSEGNISIEAGETRHLVLYYSVSDNLVEDKQLQSGMEKVSVVINPDNIKINYMEDMKDNGNYFIYKIAGY